MRRFPSTARAERVRRGLQPDLPTGLLLFGGEGSTEMVKIAAPSTAKIAASS